MNRLMGDWLMNKILLIIIGLSLVMLLSSCSTYEAVLYPCDFNKYKGVIPKTSGDSDLYTGQAQSSAIHGLEFYGLEWGKKATPENTLILTVGSTAGTIFPPHLGRHWAFTWDWPPKTATVIATDSVTGKKLFEIFYSRYTISMDSDEFHDYMQGAVEYCVKELRNSPPKDGPRTVSIPSSSLNEPRRRYYEIKPAPK
jgi:hypothetical protein